MQTPFRSLKHNHTHCISDALKQASAHCNAHKLRFTPIRKRMFELVWGSHAPIGAYELLKKLRKEKDNAEAPTVYRALDFLLDHHLIHKIESLNAYIGCEQPGEIHTSQFLICTACNQVAELDSKHIDQSIETQATEHQFTISSQTIEINGLCSRCNP